VTALAAGPDGLYFADLYRDFGAATPTDRGASVFRIRYAGVADFTADATSVVAGTAITFQDRSDVPAAAAWHWDFGDGAGSEERDPVHEYKYGGLFDVRLTVVGTGGDAVHQKSGFIAVQPAARPVTRVGLPGAATQVLEARP
jgi:PKD repeat protein